MSVGERSGDDQGRNWRSARAPAMSCMSPCCWSLGEEELHLVRHGAAAWRTAHMAGSSLPPVLRYIPCKHAICAKAHGRSYCSSPLDGHFHRAVIVESDCLGKAGSPEHARVRLWKQCVLSLLHLIVQAATCSFGQRRRRAVHYRVRLRLPCRL